MCNGDGMRKYSGGSSSFYPSPLSASSSSSFYLSPLPALPSSSFYPSLSPASPSSSRVYGAVPHATGFLSSSVSGEISVIKTSQFAVLQVLAGKIGIRNDLGKRKPPSDRFVARGPGPAFYTRGLMRSVKDHDLEQPPRLDGRQL